MVKYRLSILLMLFALFYQAFSDYNFECTGERTFTLLGVTLTCPNGTVCNKFDTYNHCNPCVSENLKCRNKFRCPTYKLDEVIIGGVQVKCPDLYKCNSKGEGDCPPCIYEGCGEPTFKCHDNDESAVTFMNVEVLCSSGTVCNKNNLPPCYPCIER